MKKIFVIDWVLIPAFLLSAATGIGLHIAGHGEVHQVWHNWAVAHIAASLAFLALGIEHVKLHWAWYKRLGRINGKSKITLLLSVVFLFAILNGIALIGVEGANSGIGLWHYKIGLALCACSLLHLCKRLPVLAKSIRRK